MCHKYHIAQNFDIKHVSKFDEQNFDELSYIYVRAAKNK